MARNEAAAPRIVRKKVVSGDAHHGGAWKVAYADFVTAMMAFFLLMWLLGATNEKQRKGIADYFNPTVPVNKISGGGEGAFGGQSVFTEDTLVRSGVGGGMTRPTEARAARGSTGVDEMADGEREASAGEDAEDSRLADLAKTFTAFSGESMVSEMLHRHVIAELTDEGLIVELFSLPDAPLYGPTGGRTPLLDDLLSAVAEVFRLAENDIAIRSHVAARPVADDPWRLAAERGNAARETLTAKGLAPSRMERVTSRGDRAPAAADRTSVRNDRLEIILLRHRV